MSNKYNMDPNQFISLKDHKYEDPEEENESEEEEIQEYSS